jgi:anti-sigma B factor antagonist
MIDIKTNGNNKIYISGRFDASQTEKADNIFDLIDNDCTIDFTGLDYISSAGLGCLLKLHVRINKDGHKITLKNLNRHVREVFKYSKLDNVFIID